LQGLSAGPSFGSLGDGHLKTPEKESNDDDESVNVLKRAMWATFSLMALIVMKESASDIPTGLFNIVIGVVGYFTAKSSKS